MFLCIGGLLFMVINQSALDNLTPANNSTMSGPWNFAKNVNLNIANLIAPAGLLLGLVAIIAAFAYIKKRG